MVGVNAFEYAKTIPYRVPVNRFKSGSLIKRVSEYESTYQIEVLLAACDGADMALSMEDEAWLAYDYGKECIKDLA